MNNVNNMYYQNYSNVNDITNIQNEEVLQKDLTSTKEGFKRGNIFANLYWPYRKQTYNFVPNVWFLRRENVFQNREYFLL